MKLAAEGGRHSRRHKASRQKRLTNQLFDGGYGILGRSEAIPRHRWRSSLCSVQEGSSARARETRRMATRRS